MSQKDTESDTLSVTVELGRTRLAREQLDGLGEGCLVPLDQRTEEPLEIFVDRELVARGEIVVLDNKFCLRIVELVTHVNTVA